MSGLQFNDYDAGHETCYHGDTELEPEDGDEHKVHQHGPVHSETYTRSYTPTEQPYTDEEPPYNSEEQPYTSEEQPYASEEQPYIREKPPYTNEEPPYITQEPPYTTQEPSYTRTKPPTQDSPIREGSRLSPTNSHSSTNSTRIREPIDSGEYEIKGSSLLRQYHDRLARETSKASVVRYSDISSTSTRTRDPYAEYQLKGPLLLRQNRNKISNATPPRTPPPRDLYGAYPRRDGFMSDSPRTSPGVTRSSDVMIGMENVVTAPPISQGPPGDHQRALRPKPRLMRRKSLNPRMVCPPGLEVLENKGLVAIRQQMELDLIAGCGASNTYKIKDIEDEQIFFAAEESSCMCRWACGPNRKFSIELFSPNDDPEPVLNFRRFSCRCDCCCCLDCFLCLQKLYAIDSLGRTIGSVKQTFSVFNTKFDVVDHDSNPLFKIVGPNCSCRCCTDIYFPIFNRTGERQIGRIQKKWGGDGTGDVNVDHEYLDVTFPERLDAVDKALLIGAAFLINVMYMEMS